MSGSNKQGTSRGWGSFLQQAVAGIESNLDNILSGDDVPQTNRPKPAPAPAVTKAASPARTASPANDRLQERLARAVAAKANAARKNGTDTPASSVPSRSGTPVPVGDSPRPSIDSAAAKDKEPLAETEPTKTETDVSASAGVDEKQAKDEEQVQLSSEQATTSSVEKTTESTPEPPSVEATAQESPRPSTSSVLSPKVSTSSARPSGDASGREQQILADADRDAEIHGYIERIDALQAKLQYLAKESAESARKASEDAAAGSLEKKLAEKDEQIALLMEEGQKLSKTELKHMTAIKQMRAKAVEVQREVKAKDSKYEKLEKEKAALAERLSRSEAAEKQAKELQKRTAQLQKDLEKSRLETSSRDTLIASLKTQLSEAVSQAKADEVKKVQSLLDAEKKKNNDLEEEVSSIKIEKELAEERSRVQINEMKESMERETERAKATEVELKGEVQLLESKLEVLRARTEEVSSGATGDAQAKLLRQIETLQTQYAVASENWQGIETTLTARITALQKERDEALKRESDTRKKAREMSMKAKANDDEVEALQSKIGELGQEMAMQKTKLEKLQSKLDASEKALREARDNFEREKAELLQQFDVERSKWKEEPPRSPYPNFDRAGSEVASSRRGLTAEFLGLQNLQTSRRPSRGIIEEMPNGDRRMSRTGSSKMLQSAGNITPRRVDSLTPFSPADPNPPMAMEPDDYFENVAESPAPHHNMNDLGSVSTTAAGPSVQLIERMSSAVRRLENEKVGMKEELLRLTSQRDEARSEIVALMQEVEEKRRDGERVLELEKEIEGINKRYQTTLEMLGEKSEQVEELREDLGDLKQMYRGLVEEYSQLKK